MEAILILALLNLPSAGHVVAGEEDEIPENQKGSMDSFRKPATAATPRGCSYAGLGYASGEGIAVIDRESRTAYFLKACDGGEAGGCTSAGWLVDNAVGIPAESGARGALYLEACDGGEAKGCFLPG